MRINETKKNKSGKVTELIMRDFAQGRLQLGDRLPSERDFCKRFGVSRVTLRAAINSMAQQGIFSRHQGRGTFVAKLPHGTQADQLDETATLSFLNIGLIISSETYDEGSCLLHSIRRALDQQRIQITFWQLGAGPTHPSRIDNHPAKRCDAWIIAGDYTGSEIEWYLNQQKPVVLIGLESDALSGQFGLPCLHIHENHFSAYYAGVTHLLENGFQRPAIFCGSRHSGYLRRVAGFNAAVRDHGIDPDGCLRIFASEGTSGEVDQAAVTLALRSLLERRSEFDALITSSSLEVLRESAFMGLRIPENFGLVAENAGDHSWLAHHDITELTSNSDMLGKIAADRILRQIDCRQVDQSYIEVPSELIVRRSSRRL